MQRAPPETSERAGQPSPMRGAAEERNNKLQVKTKVHALDGLPVDTKAEVNFFSFLSSSRIISSKRVDPLERGHNTVEGLAQSVLRQTSHHALQWDGRLVESQEGLEIKVDIIRSFLEPYVMSALSVFSLYVYTSKYCLRFCFGFRTSNLVP
ncbi:hypothetical protein M9H77_35620 [Catharanthus roseus]|uniref:Uncharacterized protein n=1 Tax=Catharanthus roseus TaxID=4058 RepID=A0ACB9ZT70_CATRO|nr:hypothetical protein M9H77_35620 [Catharanthus roseus]